jgi:hypothetical protein
MMPDSGWHDEGDLDGLDLTADIFGMDDNPFTFLVSPWDA